MTPKKQVFEAPKQGNKIRFVLLEADLNDNNFSELTAAITQALRPAPPPLRTLGNGRPPAQLVQGAAVATSEEEDTSEALDSEYEDAPVTETEKIVKNTKSRKYRDPVFLNDLDLVGGGSPSFAEFATQKNPQAKAKKYLVASFWLKEFGNSPTVTADKIYTCFKKAKWSTGFLDWSQTFYNLVSEELMRKVGNAEFAINTTGEDAVNSGKE